MIMLARDAGADRELRRDLRTLGAFIETYCKTHHVGAEREPARIKIHDLEEVMGRSVRLCPECTKLLTHAFVKRMNCPMDPKPQCKHCPEHCYHPKYRAQIREVMKDSGRRLVMRGRLDYLFHLLF